MGNFSEKSVAAESAVQPGDKSVGVSAVAELLKRNNIDPAEIGRVQRVSVWQGMSKDEDGEPQVTDLIGVQLSPTWEDGPEWPAIEPAKPTVVRHRKTKATTASGWPRHTVILPDTQIGYRRNIDSGELEPVHDEVAMACALEVARCVNPWRFVNLGDTHDFAQWSSKFLVQPEFYFTTQPAIDRGHLWLAEQRSIVGPEGEVVLLEGNHDDRMAQAVARNFAEASRLRRANLPDDWPVLSLEHLLRLDELGVQYVGGYPVGKIKLAQGSGRQTPLYARHGVGAGNVQKDASKLRQSYVQGHGHHLSVHSETYEYDDSAFDVEVWSLGCLCRIDGAVPGVHAGTDSKGTPLKNVASWQHTVGVLAEHEDGGWDLQAIRIRDGRATVGSKTIIVTPEDVNTSGA